MTIKKNLSRLQKFISLFLLCLLLTVGCNQTQPSQVSTPGSNNQPGRVTIGTTLNVRTIDPADTYELAGLNIIYNVCESLYTYQLGTTELMPLLATDLPQVSSDGLTYTIPIRQNVTFHDNTPFNAAAMEFSLQRFIENGGKPSFLLADIVDSLEASQEYELTIKLKQPFAAFTSLLAFPGTCAISPSAYTIGVAEFNPNQLIGTGPYQLADLATDSITLDVFEGYWGEAPANEGINIQVYSGNSANLFNSFLTNGIDIAYQALDPEQIKRLQQGVTDDKWQVVEANGTVVNYLVLNTQQPPLDQVEVRQAIAALIQRSLLIDRILQGQAEPLYSLIPTAFAVSQPVFEYANITKARELLTQAGYSANNPITIELWHSSGSNTRAIVASTLKAIADKELNGIINFKPNSVEFATASKNLQEGIYPTFLSDWYPDFLDPDNYIQPFLACMKGSEETGCQQGASQTQGSFYYSEKMNELIDQQRQEQNPATRQAIFAQIQDLLAQDVPYIPLWQTKDYVFVQNGIDGLTLNPSQNLPFWTLAK